MKLFGRNHRKKEMNTSTAKETYCFEASASVHEDASEMSGMAYIGVNAVLTLTLFYFYRMYCCITLVFGDVILNDVIALRVFTALQLLLLSAGIALTWYDRSLDNALFNGLPPIFLAELVNLGQYSLSLAFAVTALLLIAAALTTFLYVRSASRSGMHKPRKALLGVRNVCLPVLYLTVPCIILCELGLVGKLSPHNIPEVAQRTDGSYLTTYKADIRQLHPDIWKNLDEQQRCDLMQTVCDIECAYLGVPPIRVSASLDARYHVGRFDCEAGTIWINTNQLRDKDAENCLSTILHECYHHYQFTVCGYDGIDWDSEFVKTNLYFDNAVTWKKELSAYVRPNADTSYEEYYGQKLEVDARRYEKVSVADYQEAIEKFY